MLKIEEYGEKKEPFECGFRPLENRWQRFSIQFFLVSLIFLIFDVELILMFPILMSVVKRIEVSTILIFFIFLVILTLGFILEWFLKQLEWQNYLRSLF